MRETWQDCSVPLQFSDCALWVAFAKSSVVMAAKLNSSYNQVGPCVQVGSLHTMTVSGKGSSHMLTA